MGVGGGAWTTSGVMDRHPTPLCICQCEAGDLMGKVQLLPWITDAYLATEAALGLSSMTQLGSDQLELGVCDVRVERDCGWRGLSLTDRWFRDRRIATGFSLVRSLLGNL